MKLSLVVLPWKAVQPAPLDVGSLAAFVRHHEPAYEVKIHPVMLDMATVMPVARYEFLAASTLWGEMLSAVLLYPGKVERTRDWLVAQIAGATTGSRPSIREMERGVDEAVRALDEVLDRTLQARDWSDHVLGLPTSYNQLFSSIEFARRVKSVHPTVTIVLGGSAVAGGSGPSIATEFDCIDYVVQGEGEQPLLALLRQLESGQRAPIQAVVSRDSAPGNRSVWQLAKLDDLPSPSFEDYFELAYDRDRIGKQVSVEASRGCGFHCAFCNFTAQWDRYRVKSPRRMAAEILELSQKHRTTFFFFMDNNLPGKYLRDVSTALGPNHSFWFQLAFRTDVRPADILSFRDAGLRVAQLGIEGMSTAYLKRINKANTVINNLQAMKTMYELGVVTAANLVTRFPGSTQEEVDETYRNIVRYARIYGPVSISPFQLLLGAPAYDDSPESGSIREIRNIDALREALPDDVYERLNLPWKSFTDAGATADWTKVGIAVAEWSALHEAASPGWSLLGFHDGGTFLNIDDNRDGQRAVTLQGVQREVYLYCCQKRRIPEVIDRFRSDDVDAEDLQAFLDELVAHDLMFREGDEILSLAVAPSREYAAELIRRNAAQEPRSARHLAVSSAAD